MKAGIVIIFCTIILFQGCIIEDSLDHISDILSVDCGSDEIERDSSCQAITMAVQEKRSSCDIHTNIPINVCELNCIKKDHKEGYYCHKIHHINACINAINAMPCDDVNTQAIRAMEECVNLVIYMTNDCVDYREWEDGEDDDSNWDDWD